MNTDTNGPARRLHPASFTSGILRMRALRRHSYLYLDAHNIYTYMYILYLRMRPLRRHCYLYLDVYMRALVLLYVDVSSYTTASGVLYV